ncbi:amidohydrolase family protein [Variovorax sp. J22R133]|uniref:amidohydrolase family protein n=1 Tax=Variovorax brevis TaxID=3053503 RepID=UPI0025749389|nr:amidohydrolase family protein [Variovorax sp. J22R133]MDM0114143.1 amidohydrolase family protein [Variovorax sp. J22R133]
MQPFKLPPLATDTHVHLFDPARFPYAAKRRYTPPPATVADLQKVHRAIGVERVVLVQPSVYGFDNACLLDGLAQLGDRARGVAVVEEGTTRDELLCLYQAGVRGVRLNVGVDGGRDAPACAGLLQRMDDTLSDIPMLLQLYAPVAVTLACSEVISTMSRPVLIDHFGLVPPPVAGRINVLAQMIDLVRNANVWIKFSGQHQISSDSPKYRDVASIARALWDAASERTVWGSDWPHTGGTSRPKDAPPERVESFRPVDDEQQLALVAGWVPDEAARHKVLVSNPEKLFF